MCVTTSQLTSLSVCMIHFNPQIRESHDLPYFWKHVTFPIIARFQHQDIAGFTIMRAPVDDVNPVI